MPSTQRHESGPVVVLREEKPVGRGKNPATTSIADHLGSGAIKNYFYYSNRLPEAKLVMT